VKHEVKWTCELCEFDENPQADTSCVNCGYVENTDIKIPTILDRMFVNQTIKEEEQV